MRALLSLTLITLSSCTCAPNGATIGGRLPDGGLASNADGGTSTTTPNGSVNFTGTLRITPRDQILSLTTGQPPPTTQFTATADNQPVTPQWSVIPAAIGTIDSTGLFTASPLGGTATITASYGAATDSTSLTVKLRTEQNGGTNTMDAGAGGFGGVGGEGVGGPVDPTTLAVLATTPTSDGATFLYPYDATVWPKGLLAPLLQWTAAHPYDAVRLTLECPTFSYEGTFAKTATPFVHHPIPQAAWEQLNEHCAGSTVTVQLIFASGGQAYGPLTETWRIANGSLKGVVYYNSYGTRLAKNYSGALGPDPRFGGATLSIRGGSTDPSLVAGGNGSEANCRVCHTVSADGSTLVTQHGDNNSATSQYALRSGNTETPMQPADGRFAWGALSPDGRFLFSNAAPIQGSSSAPSALFQVPAGTDVGATGIPSGLGAGTPSFSADGKQLAFNWYAGAQADQRTLATLRFTPPSTFSDFTPVHTPTTGAALFPSFLPTGTGVVFELETVSNGRIGETRSTCDGSGPCSDIGTRAELWWVDLATKNAHPLEKLNGKGYVPTGPNAHGDDATLNYEPTVGPIASGGYAWVIFTSRRMYGNVATINPYWSDPRFHDISATPTTKKLWVAAIDLNAAPGTDPSHPAFYLPAQELMAGNSRGFWSADPCLGDGDRCGSGDQCCGGYCIDGPNDKVCSPTPAMCAKEFDRCTTAADCCDPAAVCAGNRCATIN